MILLRIVYIVFLASLLGSCKPDETIDVNQDKIFTEYEFFFNHVENRTYAYARFRHKKEKGTILKLSSSSSVAFASQPLYYNASLQQYELILDGLVSSGEFVWADTDGRLYKNSIALADISLGQGNTLIQNQNNVLPWQGLPIREDENVILFLTSDGGGAQYVLNKSQGATNMVVSPVDLVKFPKGNLVASIERIATIKLKEETDAGGSMKGRYRSLEVVIPLQ